MFVIPPERVAKIEAKLSAKYGNPGAFYVPPAFNAASNPLEAALIAWDQKIVSLDPVMGGYVWLGNFKKGFPLFTDMVELILDEILYQMEDRG